MLRKTLTLGTVFILALGLLAVSMITCFTYESEAHAGNHGHWDCWHDAGHHFWAGTFHANQANLHCIFRPPDNEHVTGE